MSSTTTQNPTSTSGTQSRAGDWNKKDSGSSGPSILAVPEAAISALTGFGSVPGLGLPALPMAGLFGLPSISLGQMMWATQQAALAQFLYFVGHNIAEHQLAVTKQIADAICPPLNSGNIHSFAQQQNQDSQNRRAS